MPGGFPFEGALSNATSLCSILDVAANATANTKGAYLQVTASCPDICSWAIQILNNPQATGQTLLVMDVAIGGPGSEVVIIPNIMVDAGVQFGSTFFSIMLPIQIKQGQRIAVRTQTNAASATNYMQLSMASFDGEFITSEGYSQVDAIGISGTPLLGTQLTPSATFLVKGAYAQLIAATVRDYSGFFLSFDMRGISGANLTYPVDLAIGGAGSEVVILPNFTFNAQSGGAESSNTPFIGISIKAGTRIAARCASVINSDTHTIGVTFYGIY